MADISEVMISASWGAAGISSFQDRSNYLDKLGLQAYFYWRTGRAMNIKVLESFIIFLMRGRTQNFDLE
jgi:hypothetical protein